MQFLKGNKRLLQGFHTLAYFNVRHDTRFFLRLRSLPPPGQKDYQVSQLPDLEDDEVENLPWGKDDDNVPDSIKRQREGLRVIKLSSPANF